MITRSDTIQQIFEKNPTKAPRLGQTLTAAGLHCVGCGAATWETLEAGCFGHGMSEEKLEQLVRQLNAILAETTNPSTITMTPRAAQKFLKILSEEGKQGWGMRFGIKAGGCGGFEYDLDFSERAAGDDQVFMSQGIEIHIAKASVPKLLGCEVDYIDGLQGAGFKVSNPNAKSSCSCGTSHGY